MNLDAAEKTVALVRYKVLFVKPDLEACLWEGEIVVASTVVEASRFVAWKLAEFSQMMARGQIALPTAWLEKDYPGALHVRGGELTGLPGGDLKFLRVSFEVLGRYPHENFSFEDQQIDTLRRIADDLSNK